MKFELKYDPQAPAVIFSPHCDDAVLNCWWYLNQGRRVIVINLFMGSSPAYKDYIASRRKEDETALKGHAEVYYIDELEDLYRSKPVKLSDLKEKIHEVVPRTSQIIAPLGVGVRISRGDNGSSHNDHLLARHLADSYKGIPLTYYKEIPYALSVSNLDYRQIRQLAAKENLYLNKVMLPHHLYNSKLKSLRHYKSQLQDMIKETPKLLSRDIIGQELYWSKSK